MRRSARRSPARSNGSRTIGTRHPRRRVHAVEGDRKSTRLNSSHGYISYAAFCLKKTNELEVKDIFRALLSRSDSAVDLLKPRYQDFRDTLGVRTTAAEMFREGYHPRAMHAPFQS